MSFFGNLFGNPSQTNKSSQQGQSSGSFQQNQQTQQSGQQQQTGQTTGQTTQQSTQTSTPNLPDWYQTFLKSLPGQFQSLQSQIGQTFQKPLIGPQQQATFQQGLNDQLRNADQTLQSQLASRGILNSGAGAASQTALQLGGAKTLADYLAQVPITNAQFATQGLNTQKSLLDSMAGFKAPYGQTTTGNASSQSLQNFLNTLLSSMSGSSNASGSQQQQSSSSGTNTTTNNNGGLLGSLFSGLLGSGLSALGGLL